MSRERAEGQGNLKSIVESYLELGNKFVKPPDIKLTLISQLPSGDEKLTARDIAVSSAYQCYSPGVAKMKPRLSDKDLGVAESTLEAGHHTTRMHMNYTFKFDGVSREVTHQTFHSHPFYNTDQQSQRYVEAKKGNFLIPRELTSRQAEVFTESADFMVDTYFELLDKLKKNVSGRLEEMYPKGTRLPDKADKICQEIARYVLPIAQKTTYYHTVNEISLLRLFRATRQGHFSDEAKYVIARMIHEVSKADPTIFEELSKPVNSSYLADRMRDRYTRDNTQDFDLRLGKRGSKMVDYPIHLKSTLSLAIDNVVGRSIPDEAGIEMLLDPLENPILTDVYDVGMLDSLTNVLRTVNLTFATKISHTADSQRQRHRMTPGALPPLSNLYRGVPDYITPMVIRENEETKKFYDLAMDRVYGNVYHAIFNEIPEEYALLLLPNAHAVRVVESGDLFDWVHRWKQRLCLLAQEEIFFVSVEQVKDVLEKLPEASYLLQAPCGMRERAGIKPRCPEGDRWCGVPVWKKNIENYESTRLV